jgi:hypothetical protein
MMTQPQLTDAEFTKLWRTLNSAAAVARHLGINERNAHARRRRIEARYDIQLGCVAQHYKQAAPENAARKHITLDDGVALVFSDAHFWPGVRTTAFRGLLMFIRELKPKLVVCNGDAFDGASISRFPRIGWDSVPVVNDELKACQERLGEIEELAKGAELYWPIGNHDARFETRLASTASQFEGVKGFTLKDHFPAWAPCWALWVNNDVVIKHKNKGGPYATRNNTLFAGKTVVTGHLHSLKVTPFDDYNGTRWGVDTGTLADPNGPQFKDYTEDNPLDWRAGFAVLTFHKGELLWPEIARVKGANQIDFRGMVLEV